MTKVTRSWYFPEHVWSKKIVAVNELSQKKDRSSPPLSARSPTSPGAQELAAPKPGVAQSRRPGVAQSCRAGGNAQGCSDAGKYALC